MTRLCVPILVRDSEQARRDALIAIECGADLIELRLDAMPPESLEAGHAEQRAVLKLVADLKAQAVPCILTLRPRTEGGQSEADDATRFERLAAMVHEVPAWVDLEWRPMARAGGWPMGLLDLAGGAGGGARFITSAHDFDGRPRDLLNLFAEMSQGRGDVVKLAWRARSVRDNVEAFELLREAAKPTVALCMGEAGLPSRVLAKKFGAYLSFAALSDRAATADGQVPVALMKSLYRWDRIGRGTRVYGVVASPVAHSRSPHVHNAAFDAADFDGVYLPLLVNAGYESFKAFMETWLRFPPLDVAGLSVTLPHKENALRYVREVGGEVDDLAERVGSVNTITIDRDAGDGSPRLRATNTDFDAMLDTACEFADCDRDGLRGKRVGILGAGGTGRTAAAAFNGAVRRDRLQPHPPAGRRPRPRVRRQFRGLGRVRGGRHDIWVNTTSLGMSPDVDGSPFADGLPHLDGATLVFARSTTRPRRDYSRVAAGGGQDGER